MNQADKDRAALNHKFEYHKDKNLRAAEAQANKYKDEAEALRKDSERLAYMLRTRCVVEHSPNYNVYWLTFPDGYVTREVFQDAATALDWAIINMAKPND